MKRKQALIELRDKVEAATAKDWRLDEEVLREFGTIRKVGRLGLGGRSGGSYRYFGPNALPWGNGSSLPSVTKDQKSRLKWIKKLDSLIAQEPDT